MACAHFTYHELRFINYHLKSLLWREPAGRAIILEV
jgi:hypothetical protein